MTSQWIFPSYQTLLWLIRETIEYDLPPYKPQDCILRVLNAFIWKGEAMVAKSSNGSNAKNNNLDYLNVRFAECRLTAEDKKAFNKFFEENVPLIGELLNKMIYDGYKYSVSWDDANECFVASFTGKAEDSVNHNWCLVSRAGSWEEATLIGFFKHQILFAGQSWGDETDNRKSWG